MDGICKKFTVDITHSQILGLDLLEEDIPEFEAKVDEWFKGAVSPRVIFLPFPKISRAYRARIYLVDKIQNKIDKLREMGPDGSTLSEMVFAKDDEEDDQQERATLTDEEIIDNALALIIAGSETSASTLTNAVLFLGLHPDVFQKVQNEQRALIGSSSILDQDMPYLEAVIKETMRIRPMMVTSLRKGQKTTVVDGKQIPEGMNIGVGIQLTHALDPVVYQDDGSHMDVEKGFQPDRWLSPSSKPGADWIAFGWGPRYCLGANLAMGEMKTFLSVFARRVQEFELATNQPKWEKFNLIIPKPADGCTLVNVRPTPTVASTPAA